MVMNSEGLQLTFDNHLGDHLAAERLYYKSTLLSKLDKVVAGLLVAVGAYLTWGAGPRWWALIWFPLAVAEWFNLLSLRPLQIMYGFKRNPKFHETYHLTLDRVGIQFRTATIDSLIKWTHYTRVLENNRLCLLVYGSRMYSVIPKRVFQRQAELSQFRSLVEENIGQGP
jgi:hypothetical protein